MSKLGQSLERHFDVRFTLQGQLYCNHRISTLVMSDIQRLCGLLYLVLHPSASELSLLLRQRSQNE